MQKDLQEWLNRYPVVFAVFFISLGIGVTVYTNMTSSPWWLAVLTAILAGLALVWPRRLGVFIWLVVGGVFFGVGLQGASKELSLGQDFVPPQSKVVVHATVIKVLATGPDFRILLLDSGKNMTEDRPLPGKGRLFLRHNTDPLCSGDRIAFVARVRKPVNRGNPGEYDWEMDNRHNGIGWLASAWGTDSILLLTRGNPFHPGALLFRVRAALTRFLDEHGGRWVFGDCGHQVRAVLKGIVLGDYGELNLGANGEIDYSLNGWFVRSGLVHMLSASGLHVGIVALMTLTLLRVTVHVTPKILLWLPFRKIAALVSIPAIALYCLIVGNRVPAVRSTIMGVVFAGAVLLGRRSSSLNSLALAAVLVLLVYPLSLCTPSAQMSFAAVFGILFVIEPVLERVYGKSLPKVGSKDPLEDGTERRNLDDMKKSMFRLVLALLVTPVAATVAVGPFLIAYFQSLPVYTLPANFVADLVMTAALPLSLLATAVGAVWPDAGAALLIPADILVWIVIKIAAFFADLPGSIVRVSAPGWLECGLFVGTCFAFLWVLRRPSRRTIAVCSTTAITLAAVVALVSWTGSFTPTLKVTFLNVGHGDAAFVRVTDSHGLLIDGGPRTRYFDSGSSILIPFLAWTGARCLDAIILTHPEADHMGGLVSVVREVPPRLLLRNTASSPDPMFAELLSAVSATNADVRAADRTCEALRIGQATVRFLNPPRPKLPDPHTSKDLNNSSVVCRLEFGTVSLLLTGDLEREGEEELLAARMPLESTVLRVGHHGSKTATSERFLDAVRPSVAVISAEYPALRRLPNTGVLQRLRSRSIEVLWTGRDGAVTIETDGKKITRISTGKIAKKRQIAGRELAVPWDGPTPW